MDQALIRAWGQIVVSILALLTFGYMIHHVTDEGTQKLLAGAVMGFASATVTFWVGSSASSQSKDKTIADSYPPGVAPPPVPPAAQQQGNPHA
jgi:hypothetical protein